MALARVQIVRELRGLLLELKKKHDIRRAYLFGSYARNTPKEYSDIDVAIVLGTFRDGGPMDERFEIFHEVQERNALYEVVCLTEEEFTEGELALVQHIKREGIPVL